MAVVKRIRPKAAKALTPLKVFSRQKERYTGGTWASWAPGQISAFANEIGQRHGRIHFAGEHTARLERGMEGAMESADLVVMEVLERTLERSERYSSGLSAKKVSNARSAVALRSTAEAATSSRQNGPRRPLAAFQRTLDPG